MNRSRALFVIICTALLMAVCPASSNVVIGDVYIEGDFVAVNSCLSKKYRNADAFIEITDSSGQWRRIDNTSSAIWSKEEYEGVLDKRGCSITDLEPAGNANAE